MRQTLHIFGKDVRRLRLELAALLLLNVLFAWVTGHSGLFQDDKSVTAQRLGRMLTIVLPASWVFLTVLLIQEEALVGNRQYWLTRPYHWKSLLGAKLFFLAVFVAAPMLVVDCVILWFQGLPYWDPPALLWRMLATQFGFVLPAAALAAVTKNLRQFALAALALAACATLGLAGMDSPVWGSATWIRTLAALLPLAAGAAAVLLLQYRRAGTARAAGVVVLSLLAGMFPDRLIPAGWAFDLTSMVRPAQGDFSRLDVARIQDRRPPFTGLIDRTTTEEAMVPVRFSGLPDGIGFDVERIDVTVTTATGARPKFTASFDRPNGEEWLQLSWKRAALPPESKPVVRVHARFFLTAYRDVGSVRPDPAHEYRLAGGEGRCIHWESIAGRISRMEGCSFAYRVPGLIRAQTPEGVRTQRYTGQFFASMILPAALGMSPVENLYMVRDKSSTVEITVSRPVAHLVRDLEIRGLKLWDYSRDNPALELERVQ